MSFKNIFVEKKLIEDDLASLNERVLICGMDEMAFLEEKALLSRYKETLSREEIFWRQKSRDMWLKNGDHNTKFFHSSVKERWVRNRIFSISDSQGRLLTDQD